MTSKRSIAAFTLIELLMVIAIIIILVSVSMPLLSKLAQSNKRSQAVNIITAYIANARSLAIQQRMPTCVVFYEQTANNANPANPNQTAIMIGIADSSKSPDPANGNLVFKALPNRQPDYMPYGIRVAAISDMNTGIAFSNTIRLGENFAAYTRTRAIVFDGSGQMIVRSGLAVDPSGAAGSSTKITADWNFYAGVGTIGSPAANFGSTPGVLVYDYREYADATAGLLFNAAADNTRRDWILANSDVIAVNAVTGNILR
jgi:Tfp pilus assembly protein FimT